jgi:glyoxylase-like metal-dependent hydrolase (beta-lactamase superfamily II)
MSLRRSGSIYLDLGDIAIVPLIEIERLEIDPAEFFGPISESGDQWFLHEPWFDQRNGSLIYVIQSFLIVTPHSVVLVDGCVGADKERRRPEFNRLPSHWLERFKETGLSTDDVKIVIFTHLHVDHVGWATQWLCNGWRPTFGRARYCVTGAELDYWADSAGPGAMGRTGDYVSDSIAPLRNNGLLDVVMPDAQLEPGIRLIPTPGHTPGSVCVEVISSSCKLLLAGDLLHHPLQLARPELSTHYCVDPVGARMARLRVLENCAQTGTILVPSHFAGQPGGRVSVMERGYTWAPAHDVVRCSSV